MPIQPSLPFDQPPEGGGPPPAPQRPVAAGRPWWARLLGGLLAPWIELKIAPPEGLPPDEADGRGPRPVCYVLEDYGLSNALILDRACRTSGLPSPLRPLPGDPLGRKRAYVALSRRNAGSTLGRAASIATGGNATPVKRHSDSLARLLEAHRADPAMDVRLVPVSIFVGRAPDKASGWFSVLFSENWALVGRFRRLLAILLNGRDTQVRFATPVSLREVLQRTQGILRTYQRTGGRKLSIEIAPDREWVRGARSWGASPTPLRSGPMGKVELVPRRLPSASAMSPRISIPLAVWNSSAALKLLVLVSSLMKRLSR